MLHNKKDYKILDEIEHVRMRPGMYIGSITSTVKNEWLFDTDRMIKTEVNYNPGLLKLFCEILDNSIDEHKRNPTKLNTIKINVSKDGEICIWDNGGIPVEIHKETNQYIPTMIFTNLRAGSNFSDEHDQAIIGTNGIGSTLVSILSNSFEITTSDGKKKFNQKILNGLKDIQKEKISKSSQHFTEIKFIPDYEFFGYESLTSDNLKKIEKRIYDCAGCNPLITFEFNGKKIKFNSFKDYIKLYSDDFIFDSNDDWNVALSKSETGFEVVSFVNSVETYDGGTHVDYVINPIVIQLREHFKKKYKLELKPSELKQQLQLFVSANINRPKFSSQTKSNMISESKDYKSKWVPSDAFMKKVLKSSIIQTIVEWAEKKAAFEEMKELSKKNKELDKSSGMLKNILKYETATSKDRSKCELFVAEGDSAKNAILSARNPEIHGIFPLKGKPINVRGMKVKDLIENQELSNLMKIIGLQFGKDHKISELRYNRLIISTDADQDGHHLCGLIINMFHELWPSLVKDGFLFKLKTPIVRVSQNKKEIDFFTLEEFHNWQSKQTNSYSTSYLKGLGSNDTKYFKEYIFKPEYKVQIKLNDSFDIEALNIAFDKNKSDERKKFIYGSYND